MPHIIVQPRAHERAASPAMVESVGEDYAIALEMTRLWVTVVGLALLLRESAAASAALHAGGDEKVANVSGSAAFAAALLDDTVETIWLVPSASTDVPPTANNDTVQYGDIRCVEGQTCWADRTCARAPAGSRVTHSSEPPACVVTDDGAPPWAHTARMRARACARSAAPLGSVHCMSTACQRPCALYMLAADGRLGCLVPPAPAFAGCRQRSGRRACSTPAASAAMC